MEVVRRSQLKEAIVFRVSITKDEFLHAGNSIDIFKARQYVVSELSSSIGEIQDYNGGIIFEQNELLGAMAKLLDTQDRVNYFLLENFFYSLSPVIMRSVMEPAALKTFYLLSLLAVEQHSAILENVTILAKQDVEFLFVLAILDKSSLRVRLQQVIAALQILPTSLARNMVMGHCYIYLCCNKALRESFMQAFEKILGIRLAPHTEPPYSLKKEIGPARADISSSLRDWLQTRTKSLGLCA